MGKERHYFSPLWILAVFVMTEGSDLVHLVCLCPHSLGDSLVQRGCIVYMLSCRKKQVNCPTIMIPALPT